MDMIAITFKDIDILLFCAGLLKYLAVLHFLSLLFVFIRKICIFFCLIELQSYKEFWDLRCIFMVLFFSFLVLKLEAMEKEPHWTFKAFLIS